MDVYLLLDCSASMNGAPFEALKQGVSLVAGMLSERRPAPISLIRYASNAEQITPLTAAKDLQLPDLGVGGASNLGKAFALLHTLITDSEKSKKSGEPDDRPLVYLFTDGSPTDDWDEMLNTVRIHTRRIIGLACGPMIRADAVRPFCDEAYALSNQTPDSLFNMIRGI
jgi:uncharacterized protein YegL